MSHLKQGENAISTTCISCAPDSRAMVKPLSPRLKTNARAEVPSATSQAGHLSTPMFDTAVESPRLSMKAHEGQLLDGFHGFPPVGS